MNDQAKNRKGISLSTQILIGLMLGFFAGLFLGEKASALAIVGRAYIGLIQMSILPYMVVSLMLGIRHRLFELREGRKACYHGGHRSGGVLVSGFCYRLLNALSLSLHQGRLIFQYQPG
jgi:hypothetical protein